MAAQLTNIGKLLNKAKVLTNKYRVLAGKPLHKSIDALANLHKPIELQCQFFSQLGAYAESLRNKTVRKSL